MIISAYPVADGIQLHRRIDDRTIKVEFFQPGDAGWEDAIAALQSVAAAYSPASDSEAP